MDTPGKYLANEIWIESNLQVTWEDNGRDYTCYSNVKNTDNQEIYSDNCTQRLTVFRKYSSTKFDYLGTIDSIVTEDVDFSSLK